MPERIKELNEALGDRYRVEREVGAGGMATVYLAQDLKHDRQVALKVFHPEVSSSVGHERFLREVQISARLNHPHILTLIDSGQVGDVLYYVIPYVEGESLRQRIEREGPLDVLDAVGLIGQITAALDYAHEQGVIHRDIKPENILIHRGEAMVSDFGIAVGLEVAKTGRLTTAGVSLGRPVYMSPEQVESDAELDVRSDIYALGCVAHEMLAGEPPFTGTSAQVVLAKILTADPTPLSEIREDVSAEVSEAIVKALARAPEDRFATAGEFGTALHDAILGQLATAGSGRWSDFRWAIAVASIAVFALVGWQLLVQADGRFAELAVEIQELADQRAYESAFASAGQGLPNDLRFEELWNTFSAQVPLIRTEPPGAEVWRRPYDAPDAWESVGTTPVSDLHIPLGMSVLRFELDGWASAEVAIVPASGDTVGVSLQPEGEVPPGMVWVPAGEAAIPNYSWANMELEPYLIDRYEVTNAEFKEFVDSGGYTEASFWTDPLTRGSGTVEWVDAIAGFVDRTGRPGPATWEAGDYRDGSDDLPVRGISWFEARAYAAFRGKELPTAFHWHRAAQVEFASYVVPMSNFGGSATAKVGQYEGLTGWGTYDMAGNVREWVSNASGPERFILGGAWDDFSWLFALAYAADPWNRSEQNGFRLAVYGDSDGLTEAGRALDLSYRDYNAEVPVSDETFEVFRSSYAYDPTPLNADVSEAEVADDWAVERVAFDAAYGDERVLADLYLPRV